MKALSNISNIRNTAFKIGIIGLGRVGSVLASNLSFNGYKQLICWDINPSINERFSRFTDNSIDVSKTRFADCKLIFFCVPDGAIVEVVRTAMAQKWLSKDSHVIHLSGSQGTSILDPILATTTCHPGVFHPFMAFPLEPDHETTFKDIGFGIAGNLETREILSSLCRDIGGFPVVITEEMQTLYHLSAVMSSNFAVMLEIIAEDILHHASFSGDTSRALIRGIMRSVQRNLARTAPGEALSGPVVRNDWSTVDTHQSVLAKELPEYLPLYQELTRQIARYTASRSLPRQPKSGKVSREKQRLEENHDEKSNSCSD